MIEIVASFVPVHDQPELAVQVYETPESKVDALRAFLETPDAEDFLLQWMTFNVRVTFNQD